MGRDIGIGKLQTLLECIEIQDALVKEQLRRGRKVVVIDRVRDQDWPGCHQ